MLFRKLQTGQSTGLITNFESLEPTEVEVFNDSDLSLTALNEDSIDPEVSFSSKVSNYLNSSHPYPSVRGSNSGSESEAEAEFVEDQLFIGLINPSKELKKYEDVIQFL